VFNAHLPYTGSKTPLFYVINWHKNDKENEQHNEPSAQPPVSVCGQSTEVSTDIIHTQGDTKIYDKFFTEKMYANQF
jgi:hypothetical protein